MFVCVCDIAIKLNTKVNKSYLNLDNNLQVTTLDTEHLSCMFSHTKQILFLCIPRDALSLGHCDSLGQCSHK